MPSSRIATVADNPPRHRPFFLAGLAVTLTAGAAWGAWLLAKIGLSGTFTGASIGEVNAHGHAQIVGWMGLFIMGFGYRAFPHFWGTELVWPRLMPAVLAATIAGLVLHVVGAVGGLASRITAGCLLAGGALEIGAVATFATQMVRTWRRSGRPADPETGFILVACGWLVVQSVLATWHHWQLQTAPDREALLAQVATYQAVLRDVQIHGLALTMILGVSQRILPVMLGVARTPARRAWRALALLVSAVVAESLLFVAFRVTGSRALGALVLVPWLMLPAAVWLVAGPWRLWRRPPLPHRSGRFVRSAYAWLALSLAGLLLLPVYSAASGLAFSHAYYGAVRHAITVGFVSQMIVGVGAWAAARFRGADHPSLPRLLPVHVLLNLGCGLRVALQIATDWRPEFFAVVGASGLLEVTALALWGTHLIGLLWPRPAARRQPAPLAARANGA
ncbi:MAG TPA: NnrS family protein [Candidatus Krumholzibacteria bacterium]|nr:NnrS family protein [Candidatus Krumholzibacteria bacterium]HPD73072.1 NnrS family protein [Candidatus Krumholzibacteria bacterium]HRY41872.1 NnrS family protein [Candidatus Krumholzibacteria bacterium]